MLIDFLLAAAPLLAFLGMMLVVLFWSVFEQREERKALRFMRFHVREPPPAPTWDRWEFHIHYRPRLAWLRWPLEGLRHWTAIRLGWLELKYWHLPPDETPGVRDVDAPCEYYEPGEPGAGGGCHSDGHYLCRGQPGCRRFEPEELDGGES